MKRLTLCFSASAGLSRFHFVDVCVQTHRQDVRFTAADPYLVWFDRSGVIQHAQAQEVDVTLELAQLTQRKWRAVLVEKDLQRGHVLEALNYYRHEVLTLLVRFLRLRHCPEKTDYGLKHVRYDLPPDDVARLLKLHDSRTPDELRKGVQEAHDWMAQLTKEIRGEP